MVSLPPASSSSQYGLNPQAIPYFPNNSHTLILPPPPLNHNTCQYYAVSPCPNTHHHNFVLPPPPPPPPSSFVSDNVEALHATLHFHEKQHEKEEEEEKEAPEDIEIKNVWKCRRGKVLRPPRWVRRFKAYGGAGEGQVEEEGGKFKNRRKKGTNHPVIPVLSDGSHTTVMIRNIPNKYSRAMLVAFLDNHCLKENQKAEEEEDISAYDIVYLPIDFKTRMNKGYGFVNFSNPKGALKFHNAINNQKWDFFRSQKICHVALARLQGKENLMKHFEAMSYPCEWEEVLPVCFSPPRDGTVKGVRRTLGKLVK